MQAWSERSIVGVAEECEGHLHHDTSHMLEGPYVTSPSNNYLLEY